MRLRELNVGCFGGGTGLPSLLGGLKSNPWLDADAVVTMFDSGGSSGVLRDELGVLPPGDILKCALALSRNAREARRVLLARLPTLEHARLGGHTGGNLLLSMMQRYSGDFLDAIDGLRALLGCRGRVWPVSVQQASVCAEYGDGSVTRGEVEVDAGQSSGRLVKRIWLEPPVAIHPAVAKAIGEFDAVIIGPGSFYTSLMPIFLVRGVAEALQNDEGPGHPGREPADRRPRDGRLHGRRRGGANRRSDPAAGRRRDHEHEGWPSPKILDRYALEHKEPLAAGELPEHCEVVGGEFWTGEIARHDRLRLAYAVWSVLSRRLLAASRLRRRRSTAASLAASSSRPSRSSRLGVFGRRLRVPCVSRRLQLGRALDDLGEHRAGVAALRRPVRQPDRRRVLAEDVLEVAVALHAVRRELGDVEIAGPVVAVLDEQPAAGIAARRPAAASPAIAGRWSGPAPTSP